VEQFADKSVA